MDVFADRYRILGQLNAGRNSDVYRVLDNKLDRVLALKLLSGGEEILAVREARVLTGLESPHILRVFNAGVHSDIAFIATDIAPMGSAEDQITNGVGVAPELAVRWVQQALTGLGLCHRRNVLHRDITPANIFLDTQDHARLGDFGVAASMEDDGTTGPNGNQRCRAPEGYGGRLTARSDLFSAGVTLWRLLTGHWPFEASTEDELATLMRTANPRLRNAAPHVHRSIADAVECALDPNPDARPSTADEMADRLRGTRTHARNWVRRSADEVTVRYESTAGGSPVAVVVTCEGQQRKVESRYVDSNKRITVGCFETTRGQLARRLRRVFDREIT
ncbi:MAG: serine/threonine protein kinase [Acidimicrobiaceae bacterium]|nr:serine/threonine protein kinase [Acidimicrobiaceae bacterium]MXZ64391.1 serine/threonine protein kinase [Acidimicrobiaceae bacterium]MYF33852.1 serine/threonine protein kinase [Acidimicrobiaceae bacterium]MYG76803.1 serine/threonine protein kinase [Acidimicrobiaceae bacterium]MYJ84153.1 serine/threonine protein kinase [Acidimicrobiaceae bacterium]